VIIAVSGLHRGDNPQPGPSVIASIRRRYPEARIIGLSYDPLESGLFSTGHDRVDAAYLMPLPGKGARALAQRLQAIGPIDMIVPCLDLEIPNYLELNDRRTVLPSKAAFARRAKDNLSRLRVAGIKVPPTVKASDLEETYQACNRIGYPVFLKGAAYGAAKAAGPSEVAPLYHGLVTAWGGPIVVQGEAQGEEEYDVVGLGDGKGGLIGACSIRKLMKTPNGKAFGGITIDDPRLWTLVKRITKALRWRGPFELEFVHGRNGYELIEFNPRFPAWVDFPSQLGCNLPGRLVDLFVADYTTPAPKVPAGKLFIRHCTDLIGDLTDIAEMT
jgi:carbamoyl-phosphate synthase large subunit